MTKRKMRFTWVLSACLLCVAAAFCVGVPLGILALVAAIPVVYLAYKPLIPTPAPIWFIYNNHIKPKFCKKAAPSPKVTPGGYREPEFGTFAADFYIAPHGSDANAGSREAPFATFARARQAVREMDKTEKTAVTVAVQAGEYAAEQILFEEADGGREDCPVIYRASGGEAVINGGFRIPVSAFSKVTEEAILRRLAPQAREQVRVADLAALGLTKEQIGKICVYGTYHTADYYDGDWVGPLHCELFVEDKRQTLARYPNGDRCLGCGKVLFTRGGPNSESLDSPDAAWRLERNPKSDVFEIDGALVKRMASWESLEDVWMFGYWRYDWADATTPVGKFDPEKGTLSPKFVSQWGVRKDAPYYFFNVLEELDAPGEWYLDRGSLKLYLFPEGEPKDIFLSVSRKNLLKVCNAHHLTFDGFTFQGTRGDAVSVEGSHITFENCTVKNVAGHAMTVKGTGNRIRNCHITRVGKAGILLDGGDRETLTPGGSVVENCLIHSWSEIYKTYCPAIDVKGVGHRIRHNEMYDSPHEVIWYHGNDHVIEYNHIHDACLLTKDGGAIYAGKSWSYYGNVIRGNVIHDLGTPYYTACAIYMDDAMSGQTICDNLLVNIPGIAIQLGGGRDYTVKNNTIINCANSPISYDNRAIEGALHGTWFHYCTEPGGLMWQWLHETAYKSEIWQKRYPQMAAFCEDFEQARSPYFIPNPGCSDVSDNLTLDAGPFHGHILCREAKKFGNIRNNPILPLKDLEKYFPNAGEGNYEK